MLLQSDAKIIMAEALEAVLPDAAVTRALQKHPVSGQCYVIAIGKAAYRMAATAHQVLGAKINRGLIVTKYAHGGAPLPAFEQIEAGHPVPDEMSLAGGRKALEMVAGLTAADTVVFLVSGGGSALFELPLEGISLSDIAELTQQLLACGADITEINTLRKRLSAVKGGRFAQACAPAKILTIVLSDVLGDPLDSIASGPTYPDAATTQDALAVLQKYRISLSRHMMEAIQQETPKSLENVTVEITGNVRILCDTAAQTAKRLGYTPLVLSTTLNCEAREAGSVLGAIVREVRSTGTPLPPPCAVILGGETVVHLRGNGRGGRNQELALAGSLGIEGLENVLLFSLGSDGTDGPTDAAGGMVDGSFAQACRAKGLNPYEYLQNNDSYTLLKAMGALLVTGPTGTNVNDLTVALVR